MKRFLFLLVGVLFPCLCAHGQLAVIDATLNGLLIDTKAEQVAYFAQSLADSASQLEHLASQVEHAGKQVQMQMQNLANLRDVENLDGFKEWYNRQLYLEQMTEQSFKGMNVNIGKKNYSMWDLDGIADGLNDTYIQYWNKEFTEEQRREMWIGLGLSPANYAYVQPYRVKAREIAKEMFAMSAIQNHKNEKYAEAIDEISDEMKNDSKKDPKDQMGAKQVMQRILQMLFIQSEMFSDTNSLLAKDLELKGAKEALDRPLQNDPELSNFDENAWDLTKH